MEFQKIPFEYIGIDKDLFEIVFKDIEASIASNPKSIINIQKIAHNLSVDAIIVKNILYFLYYKEFIVAKFVIYHRVCGHPISRVFSNINEAVVDDFNGIFCAHCQDPINIDDEIEIRMFFYGKENT